MKMVALAAIGFYRRFVSPYKGFCCAYREHTGRASCSALGYRAIRRFGAWQGIGVLRKRLARCGVAHRRYSGARAFSRAQGGFCDLSCDLPCDFDFGSAGCDVLSNCGSPCDCGNWGPSRKNREEDQWVHIPPNTGSTRRTIGVG